jgi:2-C-methyl-D-erythritol 4-phosphate cytidylyltransferase
VIGGIVLAAGAGTRFGGTKQLAELQGRPLLEHAVRTMSLAPDVGRAVVVLGSEA